ncbi:MAG: sodium:solute symporter, partial [Planctomycetota bacterium]
FGCDNSQAQRLLTSKDASQSKKSLLMSAFAKVPMQGFVLLLGVLMWLFYATHTQPLLYKPDHIAAAQSVELAPQVRELETAFATAHAERKEALLVLTALPGDIDVDHAEELQRYQRAVQAVEAVRKQARTLVGGATDSEGRPKDDRDTNNIFCRYILDEMPPVLLGLILAAIFAAAMSSIDSVLNALSGATVIDFYRRWLRPNCSEQHALRAGKVVTLFWGAIATMTALFLGKGGSIIETINKIGSWFYGSLLGIFAMALFMRRAGDLAGALGLCGGMAAVVVVHNSYKVQFLWYNVVGLAGVLVVGGLVAIVVPRKR